MRQPRDDWSGLAPPGPGQLSFAELVKAKAWAETRIDVLHFRDAQKREVDLILEAEDGRIVALEVKAALTVSPKSFTHLSYLPSSTAPNTIASPDPSATIGIRARDQEKWAGGEGLDTTATSAGDS